MSKHTPGPWEPTNSDDLDYAQSYVVCTLDDGWYVSSEHKPTVGAIGADTRLIAAAPSMKKALTDIIMAVGYTRRDPDVEKAILEGFLALEKANGGIKGNPATEEGSREREKVNFLCDGLEEMNNEAKGQTQ